MIVRISEAWKASYPEALVGTLVMHQVSNPPHHLELDKRKREFEDELRRRFTGATTADLETLPPVPLYNSHYKRYNKTYPVLQQLVSIALKNKSIPQVAGLVEAMFIAEVKNLLLTAGHDLEAVVEPVTLDVSRGDEYYVQLNGQEQRLKPGDMMMTDNQGVISSVLYGPDYRTRITPNTRHVFFVVYAPKGIGEEAIRQHLDDIRANVMIVAPEAEVGQLDIYGVD